MKTYHTGFGIVVLIPLRLSLSSDFRYRRSFAGPTQFDFPRASLK